MAKHPWGRDLENVAHLGWCSGAPNPDRTDWSALEGIQAVTIVGDNDAAGKRAIPRISRQLSSPVYMIQFSEKFGPGFDLADPFPKSLFLERPEGTPHYAGPLVDDCLHPATWATREIKKEEGKKGRPSYRLRDDFASQWVWLPFLKSYAHTFLPLPLMSQETWARYNRRFSDVAGIEDLFLQCRTHNVEDVDYQPGTSQRLIDGPGQRLAFNLYFDSRVKPDPSPNPNHGPWTAFLKYLIPDSTERHQAMRWIATLLAKPGVRIGYSMLLVSEAQGVGKSLLGGILAQIVGRNNASSPGISDILSDFNGWAANRRLAVVHEIYGEQPRAVYNRLKSLTTDRNIAVNQKFVPQYEVANFCHVFACSNSLNAIRLEDSDRRWYFPTLTEKRWPREKFRGLWQWVGAGGLSIIRAWAEDFDDFVDPGEHAPETERKKEAIRSSEPEHLNVARQLASLLMQRPNPAVLVGKEVRLWLAGERNERVDMRSVKRTMLKEGGGKLWAYPTQLKIHGYPERLVLYNRSASKALREAGEVQGKRFLSENVISPSALDQDRI